MDANADQDARVLVDAGSRKAATPTFSPPPGPDLVYPIGNIAITSATPGAEIHFTTEERTPTAASTLYVTPLKPTCTVMELRAIALAPGLEPSDEAVGVFAFIPPFWPVSPVTYVPSGGTYPGSVDVALSTTTAPSVICFTLDGSVPVCAYDSPTMQACQSLDRHVVGCEPWSNRYEPGSPVHITPPADGGAVTIQAVACKDGFIREALPTASTYSFSPP